MANHFIFRKHTPRWIIFMIDMGIVFFSLLFAYLLRFNFSWPTSEVPYLKFVIPIVLIVRAGSFIWAKTFASIIRYTSGRDTIRIMSVVLYGSLFFSFINGITYFAFGNIFIFPFSIIIIDFLLTTFVMVFSRILIRLFYDEVSSKVSNKTNVLIFGAGEAGVIAKRSIEQDPNSSFQVVGFVDDDQQKTKRKLENKPINPANKLDALLEKGEISHLIVSVQNLRSQRLYDLTEVCLRHRVKVLNVPPVRKWINGELSAKQIREIRIEDLLGRQPIQLDEARIKEQVSDKVILVSGAAGSIGSEIVRQLIRFSPKKVVMIDQAESPLYELEIELAATPAGKVCEAVVADVRNALRMERIFDYFKPQLVFHAAAYKHVPLMENNPSEAVRTNICGSKIIADLSHQYKVQTFVMVSTDKAVNPTNVMGASKRIAEIYTQAFNEHSETRFITTRFGNVLGSNGSVIPLFKRQIENGGPITVTHPEITRYFMTIPEACQLVLEAGAHGKGGEVFVFDMGESVKILDLAKQMVQLSGLELGKDIQIVHSGLRPGEKLYEELLSDQENTLPTHHAKIMIAKVAEYPYQEVDQKVKHLIAQFDAQDNSIMVQLMKDLVPEFKSQNSVFESLDLPEEK